MKTKKTPQTRNTRQREIILNVLRGTDTHPTADWIYERVRKRLPSVSLGTVYRNLHWLKERDLIGEMKTKGRKSRYDGCVEPHYHFYCERCGNIVDLKLPGRKIVEDDWLKTQGFEVRDFHAEFHGICNECKRK